MQVLTELATLVAIAFVLSSLLSLAVALMVRHFVWNRKMDGRNCRLDRGAGTRRPRRTPTSPFLPLGRSRF